MNGRRIRIGIVALAITAASAGAAWFAASGAQPEARPVHDDPAALERAMLEAFRELFREDAPAARKALDRMLELSRRLSPEERDHLGGALLSTDRAYRTTLNGVREKSGAGEVDAAYDEFDWVQRTCRDCHGLARERGLLPAEGPLWPAGG